MIDDKLDNYNVKYEYKFDENCCQQETLNLVVIRICDIYIDNLLLGFGYLADVSVVME